MRLLEKNEMKVVSGGFRKYIEVRYSKKGEDKENELLVFDKEATLEQQEGMYIFCQGLFNLILKDNSMVVKKYPLFADD